MAEGLVALAEGLAADLRPLGVPVDLFAMARALGVEINLRSMPPSVHGASPSAHRVVINQELTLNEQRFTLAHELAHVLVKRGRAVVPVGANEERFADAFAAAVLVPDAALPPVVDISHIAARLQIDPAVVEARAVRAGRRISRRRAA